MNRRLKKQGHFEAIFLKTPFGQMLQHKPGIFNKANGEYIDDRVKISYQVFIESLENRSTFLIKDELSDYMKSKFIAQAKELHGDDFDYDKIEFIGKNDIRIFCNKHQDYIVVARKNHVTKSFEKSPVGCKVCYHDSRKLKLKEVKEQLTELWNGYYSYVTWTEYKNSTFKIPVICPVHGTFHVNLSLHKNRGVGCGNCYNDALTRKSYLEMIRNVKAKLKGA